MNTHTLSLTLILTATTLLGACASNIPVAIRTPVDGDIRVDEVQQDPQPFIDSRVRWGGEIIEVENLADETRIEILAQKLNKSGKPVSDSKSGGRFIARIDGFLEPEDFPKKRKITIVGIIDSTTEKPVGDYPYVYPVVKAGYYYLWPKEQTYPRYYYHDPFYDPFYYPYYPYYWNRYPYRH
ncbi:MAG: Slp family lipoprotein [Candidatus Thiodiazotropha sp.]